MPAYTYETTAPFFAYGYARFDTDAGGTTQAAVYSADNGAAFPSSLVPVASGQLPRVVGDLATVYVRHVDANGVVVSARVLKIKGQPLEAFGGPTGGSVTKAAVVATGLAASDIGGISAASPTLTGTPTLPTTTLFGTDPIAEYVQDTVAGFLVAGSGISLTYDDAGNTLTVGNTGSGGGLDPGTQYVSIKTYGAVGDNSTECYTAIRSAFTAAANLASSSGFPTAVYIPSGTFKVTMPDAGGDFLTWASKVSMIGAGPRGVSRIVMSQSGSATDTPNFIKGTGANVNNPYTGCHFRGFEIDMTGTFAPASYTPTKGKAFYMQYNKNCSWSDLTVRGSKASGIGVDYLVDCHIQNNIVDSCGNFVAAQGTGDSGIGIGSGQSSDEYAVITGNIVTNCRNYGIFTEKQGAGSLYYARGFLVANNSCRGNRVGIADTGAQGSIIAGNQVNDNTAAGISVGQSAIGSGANDGRETLVYGNVIMRNGGTGVGASGSIYTGRVTIRGNRSAYNTGAGIAGTYSSSNTSASNPASAMTVVDNDVHNNGGYGLDFGPTTNSGYVRDLIIERNRVFNNDTAGLRLKLNITRLRLVGNVFWDDQAARTVTDGVTNTTTTLTSATAAFSLYDVGRKVTGAGIPAGTIIQTYTSATTVVLSQAATATASGVTVVIGQAATQTTGMSIVTGVTVTDGLVKDNDARGCTTPYAVTLSVFAGNLVLESNPGLTGGGPTSVTVGASPFTYTAGRTAEDLYVDGGTVTSITKGGTTVATSTGRLVRLAAGDVAVVTYSSAPTIVSDKR